MNRAILTELPNGDISIEAPYNSRFVSAIKQIPIDNRTFDTIPACTNAAHHGCSGRWIVTRTSRHMAMSILRNFYPEVREITQGRGVILHKGPEER